MKRKVLIFDTSVLTVYLELPGFPNTGAGSLMKDKQGVDKKIQEETEAGTLMILPIATIIETGNHISHILGDKFAHVNRFVSLLLDIADNKLPWAMFSNQSGMWSPENVKKLAIQWKEHGVCALSIGDESILDVAKYYCAAGYEVEVFTGDEQLYGFSTAITPSALTPRRRRSE